MQGWLPDHMQGLHTNIKYARILLAKKIPISSMHIPALQMVTASLEVSYQYTNTDTNTYTNTDSNTSNNNNTNINTNIKHARIILANDYHLFGSVINYTFVH